MKNFLSSIEKNKIKPQLKKSKRLICKIITKVILISIGYIAWYLFIGLLPYWIQVAANLMDEMPNPLRNLDFFNQYAIIYTICLIVYAEFYEQLDWKRFLNRGLLIIIIINLAITCFIMGHFHYIASLKNFYPFSPPKPFNAIVLITPLHLMLNYLVLGVLLLVVSVGKAIKVANLELTTKQNLLEVKK
ncbi:hypothetical protein [Acinetobacter pittii]|uniref:hypothetical protein n=1 Tax=Acinetobacter pittii TaxID=48296 RepID=UPI0023800914|nr:hypothetical protein [Acinetobacter pittii]MDE4040394.1 hypothetical protein [Acinetobacter pittii]